MDKKKFAKNQSAEVNIAAKAEFAARIIANLQKVIIGQQELLEKLLVALIAGGHVLIEGVPGLAKTLVIKSFAALTALNFKRIQFTPDLLPGDLIGTMVFDPKNVEFFPHKGPIFTNFLLADEINRAPAKVQSALLEAMQERQVTIGDRSFKLDEPFMVLATQNPIEQEGTYHLPEAQVDRFFLKIKISYPEPQEEKAILTRFAENEPPVLSSICSAKEILELQECRRMIYVDERLKDYIVNIVSATRNPQQAGLPELNNLIAYGASVRASLALFEAARSFALLQKRNYVIPDDIKNIAADVLRHRLILSYEAEAEQLDTDQIITRILQKVAVP